MSIFLLAIKDRMNLIEGPNNVSIYKKISLDIAMKYIILLINSFGRKNTYKLIYVDEINNRNMRNNLFETRKNVKLESSLLCFDNLHNFNKCVKLGIINSLLLFIVFNIQMIILICLLPIFVAISKKIYCKIILFCVYKNFEWYIHTINYENMAVMMLMSDHHFFGAIISNIKNLKYKSIVLQHGAICDVSYYYPVYADKFLAWGKASANKINDSKVNISGTYKFNKFNFYKKEVSNFTRNIKVLWPLRPLNNRELLRLYEIMLNSLGNIELENKELIIKKHPSKFSDFSFSKSVSSKVNIKFVDCDLENIDFDIAIIDNSTIGYDLMMLNKPFIVFKNLINSEIDIGYERYGIPVVFNDNDLTSYIKIFIENKEEYLKNFNKSINLFIDEELNSNQCCIDKIINELQEDIYVK